ncbi:MAG: hypothetical protein KUG77_02675 [Nannocystaceae bacterium]|nr:hypothetical protein [Nannocystaceae bacterium]
MKTLIQASLVAGIVAMPVVASADPGQLVGIEIDSVDVDEDTVGDNIYGYWEYLPTDYDTIGEPFPMIIFLSGIGENGNGTLPPGGCSGPNHTGEFLCRNLRHGPQMHLWSQLYGGGAADQWDDQERPFIVISPQNPAPLFVLGNPYDPADMEEYLDFLIANYNVDPRRIYLTGMSMGGYSVSLHAVNDPGRYAAVALLPGVGVGSADPETPGPCDIGRTALWAFHGDNDGVEYFDPDDLARFVQNVADCPEPHPVAQLTMYQGAGHNVWARTINPADGMNDPVYDGYTLPNTTVIPTVPYDVGLYTWLLQHDLPEVSAGPDFTVNEDEGSFDITAFIIDDDAVTFEWTQTGGGLLTLTGDDTQTLTVTALAEGTYDFRVFALDADDQYDEDTVTITVLPTKGGSESEGETSDGTTSTDGTSSEGTTSDGTTSGESSTSPGSTSGATTGSGGSSGAVSSSSGASATSSGSSGTSNSGSASDSASGDDSASGNDSSASASDADGSGGEDTDTDSSGANSSDGGCAAGGHPTGSLWMLGLFGLASVRRRRD